MFIPPMAPSFVLGVELEFAESADVLPLVPVLLSDVHFVLFPRRVGERTLRAHVLVVGAPAGFVVAQIRSEYMPKK